MIRTDAEYKEAVAKLDEQAARLRESQTKLKEMNLSKEDIKRALDPLRTFSEQLKDDVQSYERLNRGEFDELRNFEGIGRLLVALRIASGMSQRELAHRLGVHESAVSRDERNEYHGISFDRASRLLDALDVKLSTTVVDLPRGPAEHSGATSRSR